MFMPNPPKETETLLEGRWRLLQKLDGDRSLYEECYYDQDQNLVRLPTRRIYKGKLLAAEYFTNSKGEKDGKYTEYDEEGNVTKLCYYREGILEGLCTEYWKGQEISSVHFKSGKPMGHKLLRNKKGVLVGYELYTETGLVQKASLRVKQGDQDEQPAPSKGKKRKIRLPIGFYQPTKPASNEEQADEPQNMSAPAHPQGGIVVPSVPTENLNSSKTQTVMLGRDDRLLHHLKNRMRDR